MQLNKYIFYIKKEWYICTMKYYSAIKKNEIMHLQQREWT